jgi:tetratricopeptide (TPR) repeat protein
MKLHKLSHLLFFFILLFPASGIIILGCSSGAIKHYTTINPQLAEAYYNRGGAKYESGDKAGAIKDLETAKQLFQQQGDIQNAQKVQEILNKL